MKNIEKTQRLQHPLIKTVQYRKTGFINYIFATLFIMFATSGKPNALATSGKPNTLPTSGKPNTLATSDRSTREDLFRYFERSSGLLIRRFHGIAFDGGLFVIPTNFLDQYLDVRYREHFDWLVKNGGSQDGSFLKAHCAQNEMFVKSYSQEKIAEICEIINRNEKTDFTMERENLIVLLSTEEIREQFCTHWRIRVSKNKDGKRVVNATF